MHFGHIFHDIGHIAEGIAIHEGESVLEHAAIGVVSSLI